MRVLPCKPLVRLPRSSVLRPIHHLFRASPLTPLPPPIYTISNQSGIKPMYKLLSLFILIAILFLILNHCRNQQQGVFRLKIGWPTRENITPLEGSMLKSTEFRGSYIFRGNGSKKCHYPTPPYDHSILLIFVLKLIKYLHTVSSKNLLYLHKLRTPQFWNPSSRVPEIPDKIP